MGGWADGQMGRLLRRFRCPSAHLLICSSLMSCGSADAPPPAGTMEAHWTGGDTGSLRAAATARWCAERRFGEVLSVSGDTGIAVAIRHADSLAPGRYGAVLPDSADTAAASSTIALRFLGRTSVNGYQSDSGSVTLQRNNAGRLGVDFDVRARVVGAVGRIRLRGRAAGVPVVRGGEECTAPWRPSE
jgi:hypothetical protein